MPVSSRIPASGDLGAPRETVETPERSLAYDGTWSKIFKIALTNALLGFVTLGFYRFWGKTRIRRYLWGGITFDDDRLEYTGRPMELLLGFLVALLILAPLTIGVVALQLALAGDDVRLASLESLQALIFLFLFQVAIYRARRYRLSRSQWRGIRGSQTGSATLYALLAMGLMLLTLSTFGLAYPFQRTQLQAYRLENTWFGNRRFSFDARARQLFWPWLLTWVLMLPSLGVILIWYRVREFRYFAAHTRLGGLDFHSKMGTGRVIWIILRYWSIFAAVVLAIGAIVVFGFGLGSELFEILQGNEPELASMSMMFIPLLFFGSILFVSVLMGVIHFVLVVQPLLREICTTLTLRGDEDFEAIRQSEQARAGRGEGLADAFDVGSI